MKYEMCEGQAPEPKISFIENRPVWPEGTIALSSSMKDVQIVTYFSRIRPALWCARQTQTAVFVYRQGKWNLYGTRDVYHKH